MSEIKLHEGAQCAHSWVNDQHDDGHIEARCEICLVWIGDWMAHSSAAGQQTNEGDDERQTPIQ